MITTTNPTIINFYQKYPSIDFDKVNLFFIQIIENLFSEVSTNTNEVTALLKNVNENILELKTQRDSNFNELRADYTRDLQMLLNNNNQNNIRPMLVEYTKSLQNDQQNLNNKISEILQKFQGSSTKGRYSETAVFNLLVGIYGERNLKMVSNTPESGDIHLIRNNKPLILIENKEYTDSVDLNEVSKFIRDINTNSCSGILMSQNSKIANKKDFEINIQNSNVTIYLANVKYDTDLIEIAVNVIDTITKILPDDEPEKEFQLSKDQLDLINQEFNNFMLNKTKHIKTIKDFSKTMLQETEQFSFPILSGILSLVYGTTRNTEWTCEICGQEFKNKGALASHAKKHKRENV
jgi:hypothetical protein